VAVYADFTLLLGRLGAPGTLGKGTIRVVAGGSVVPSRFEPDVDFDPDTGARGKVAFRFPAGASEAAGQDAYVYFGVAGTDGGRALHEGAPGAPELSSNLIANPGFEDGEGDGAAHWSWRTEEGEGRGRGVGPTTEFAKTGRRSFGFDTLDLAKGDARGVRYAGRLAVRGGSSYLLSFWHKCTRHGTGVAAVWVNFHYPPGTSGPRRVNVIPLAVPHDWTYWGRTIDMPEEATHVSVDVALWRSSGYTGYFDDFELSAVDIPVLDAVETRARRVALPPADVDALKVRLIERTWRRDSPPEAPPVDWASDAARRQGCMAFPTRWQRMVHPDTRPQRSGAGAPVRGFATPGEREPLAFAVHALRDLPAVSIEVGALAGPAGAQLPPDRIDVRQVRSQRMKTMGRSWRECPSHLEGAGSEDLPAGRTRQYWLTVHVPQDASAGVYAGRVRVRSGKAEAAVVDLEFEVLPFALARPDTTFRVCNFANVYRYHAFNPGSGNMLAQFRDIKAHGIESTGNYCRLVPHIAWRDGEMILDFDRPPLDRMASFAQTMAAFREAGLAGPVVWQFGPHHIAQIFMPHFLRECRVPWALGPAGKLKPLGELMKMQEFQAAFQAILRRTFEERERRGWPELVPLAADEPHGFPGGVEAAMEYLKLLRAATPEGTTVQGLFVNRPEDVARFAPEVDILCVNFLSREVFEAVKRHGNRLFLYNLGTINQPWGKVCGGWKERFIYGLLAWAVGADGVDQYVYTSAGSSFDSAPAGPRYGDRGRMFLTLQGPDGPLPTPNWEGVREGIDDRRYIATLEALIAAHAGADGGLGEAVAKAGKLLAEVRAAAWGAHEGKLDLFADKRWMIAELGRELDFDAARRRLAEAIREILRRRPQSATERKVTPE